jgi:Putative peptidoglycan binding domain
MNYTDLRMGDRLPTVGVLQRLLNRAGAGLNCDGVFGPKTQASVKHFQHAHRLAPDGIVGRVTWRRLVEGVDLPIVDCVDVFDSFQREEFLRAKQPKKAAAMADTLHTEVDDITSVGGSPFVLGGMSNGVEQAVSLVCGSARESFLLRFHGHGYPGSVGITAGSGGPNQLNRINADSLPKLQNIVMRLSAVFGPYASVELMSCQTARGAEGRRLVAWLAAIIGVPVSAGVNNQYAGGFRTFRFEGPTFTSIPFGGTLKRWCEELPAFSS